MIKINETKLLNFTT